jgi:hypothetical protein
MLGKVTKKDSRPVVLSMFLLVVVYSKALEALRYQRLKPSPTQELVTVGTRFHVRHLREDLRDRGPKS